VDDDDFYVPDDDNDTTKPPEAAPVTIDMDPLDEIEITRADVDTAPLNNTNPPLPLDDHEDDLCDTQTPDEEEFEASHEGMLSRPEILSELRRLGLVIGTELGLSFCHGCCVLLTHSIVRQPLPETWPPYLPTDPPSWVRHDKALKQFLIRRGTLTDPSCWHKFLSRRFAGDDVTFQVWWMSTCFLPHSIEVLTVVGAGVWQTGLGLNSEPDITEPESKPSKRPPPLSSSSSPSSIDSATSEKACVDGGRLSRGCLLVPGRY
jgi:hypothetical protein